MSATPERVRLALIGAGTFARKAHVPALVALSDRFQVVAVCSRTRSSAEELAALLPEPVALCTELPSLLARDDLDAVDMVLPIPAMPQAVAQALEAGKHVISEKPIAPSVAEGRRLLAIHHRHPDRVWMVAENVRYEASYTWAGQRIREGAIGVPWTVDFAVQAPVEPGSPYHRTLWRRSEEVPGGFLLDGGVHHVAALRQVVGEIRGVMAQVASHRPDLPPADTLAAVLHFANGAIGTYTVTYGAGSPLHDNAIHVVGSRGALRVTAQEVRLVRGEPAQAQERAFEPQPYSVQRELAAFADAIQHGRAIRNTPEEALQDLAVVEAMLESAQEGTYRAIDLWAPAA